MAANHFVYHNIPVSTFARRFLTTKCKRAQLTTPSTIAHKHAQMLMPILINPRQTIARWTTTEVIRPEVLEGKFKILRWAVSAKSPDKKKEEITAIKKIWNHIWEISPCLCLLLTPKLNLCLSSYQIILKHIRKRKEIRFLEGVGSCWSTYQSEQ